MNKLKFGNWFLKTFNWLGQKELQQIYDYATFLQEENKKYNLTRLDNDGLLWEVFFYQTLLCYQSIWKNQFCEILDIGSGNGCPGMILKIIWPKTHLTIIESNTKKCAFLQALTKQLSFQDVQIIHQRAEQYFYQCQKRFDLVTAIAVANLETICELTIPYAKVNGLIVLPKSRNYLQEVKDLNKLITTLSCQLNRVLEFDVCDKKNNVLYLQKQRQTKPCYPRVYREIIKGFNYDK